MMTYLDMIECALASQNHTEPFRSLKMKLKRMARKHTGKPYNHRAFVAAIKRGMMRGKLMRDVHGHIGTCAGPLCPPPSSDMHGDYRACAEHHREERMEFSAVVGRRGFKRGSKGVVTVLLTDVCSLCPTDGICINHAWVSEGVSFANVQEGDVVRFAARIRLYPKVGGMDYKLFYPAHVRIRAQ